MHFYYSLGTLGTFKRTSCAHLEHLEHWSHFKNWAEADTLPLPSSGRYPLLLHLGNNRHISRCLSSSWPCCARWGGHCGRRCTCHQGWFGLKKKKIKRRCTTSPRSSPWRNCCLLHLGPCPWKKVWGNLCFNLIFTEVYEINPSTKKKSILSSKVSLCSELHSIDVKVNGGSYEGVSKGGRAVVESFHRHHVPVPWTNLHCAELFILAFECGVLTLNLS